jgi:hypothetical protein
MAGIAQFARKLVALGCQENLLSDLLVVQLAIKVLG